MKKAKGILKQFKTELLAIPGVEQIRISRDGAKFAFSVFVSEETEQDKIPRMLKGVPVSVTIQKTGTPNKALQKARSIRNKYKRQLLEIGVQGKDIQIVAVPGGDFGLVVAVDRATNQEKIPKFLEGIPVRVVVREDDGALAD